MRELVAALNEAESNLQKAISSLNGMYRIGAPARATEHMAQSITTWRTRRDAIRDQIEAAAAEDGAVEVVEIITEPTPAERRRAEADQPVTITREQLDNLVWLAENQMRDVEQRVPTLRGAAGGERVARKALLERSAATLRSMQGQAVSRLVGMEGDDDDHLHKQQPIHPGQSR